MSFSVLPRKGFLIFGLLILTSVAQAEFQPSKIDWSGKFRYRFQTDDYDVLGTGKSYVRERQRALLELSAKANLTEEVMFGAMLGTETTSSGGRAKSMDADFKDTTSLAINLRRAYLGYSPEAMKGLILQAGAMPNPFALVAGSDLIFELVALQGTSASYEMEFGDFKIRPTFGQFVLREREKDTQDTTLHAAQVDMKLKISDFNTQFGFSTYYVNNVAGKFSDKTAGNEPFPTGAFGNSVTGSGATEVYLHNYYMNNAYVSFGYSFGDLKANIFYDYVKNAAAEEENEAYLAGLKLNYGSWEFMPTFREVKKDGVFGAIAWDDPESTGKRSNYTHVGYKLTSNLELRGTYITHETIALNSNGGKDKITKMKLDIRASF